MYQRVPSHYAYYIQQSVRKLWFWAEFLKEFAVVATHRYCHHNLLISIKHYG